MNFVQNCDWLKELFDYIFQLQSTVRLFNPTAALPDDQGKKSTGEPIKYKEVVMVMIKDKIGCKAHLTYY